MLIVHTASLAEDETALVHATALALRASANLISLHACHGPREQPELPSAVPLLQRWGLTAQALRHERVIHECCDDTADTLLDAFRKLQPDWVVAATHARAGVARLLQGSVAEAVARNLDAPTLLLPPGCSGFVHGGSGQVALERVLVPVGSADEAKQALDATFALALDAGQRALEVVLLHVDDGHPAPAVALPRGWRLTPRAARGPLDAAISATARELNVDLVVMATHGHDSVLDVLLGSTTERVLHALHKPLLWVPFTWRRQIGRS